MYELLTNFKAAAEAEEIMDSLRQIADEIEAGADAGTTPLGEWALQEQPARDDDDDPDWVVEHKGTYKSYDYYVRLGKNHGCRCGYVRTPQGVPGYVYFLEVHGGVTYVADDDSEFGFDCAHSLDAPDVDAVRKHFGQEAAAQLEPGVPGAEARSLEYAIDQCKKLIDQLPQVDDE